MSKSTNKNQDHQYEEINLATKSGMSMLILNTLLTLAALGIFVLGIVRMAQGEFSSIFGMPLGVVMIVIGSIYAFIIGPILYGGLKIVKPNEALVLALFGKYIGTIKHEGFFFVNPFATPVNPAKGTTTETLEQVQTIAPGTTASVNLSLAQHNKKISLKASTLSNNQQKINDKLGNPIIIGIVVIWKVTNTAKAVFNVDNYKEFLSIQCDSALRNIVRLYPYDSHESNSESSLSGSSGEVAEKLKEEIQSKVNVAGLEILEARITHLAYAPEIAAVMLQRQQASAIIDAKQMIVEGAVGMVEMALSRLSEKNVVHLDEERKAAMVSNLLVVLCGNRDAQPVVNSGSIYNV
ncbi:MAG: SPFH domain-containing protein [Defluviitaleaceae bacterium]|nr:SPFH domain-containing protein [Defluviitaleaceae bacterium]